MGGPEPAMAITGRRALVDPGGGVEHLEAAIAENRVEIEKILVTHGQLDHAGAAAPMASRLEVPIERPRRGDLFLIESGARSAARTCRGAIPKR